jgi:cysteine-rich repeat protein
MKRAALALLLAACAGSREADPADATFAPVVFDAALPDALVRPDAAPPDAGRPDADAPPAPVCGNGVREGSEECDDGNGVDTDACRTSCAWARCGDGVVRTGAEDCDDGNTSDDDACNSLCTRCSGGDARFTWSVNHHCYSRFATPATWANARAACAAQHTHLATLTSDAENGAVTGAILLGTVAHWMGLNDEASEGSFAWITDEPSGYGHFDAGEPNNASNEDCVTISAVGLWNDLACGESRAYLCEDDGWFVRPQDHHAYKVVSTPVTWSAALADCASLAGHLVTISSAEEDAFVAAHAFGNLWGGATDAAAEGTFTWVTGEPFAYTGFQASEPNNAGPGEDCLELSIGRGWNDLGCGELRAYVCEVE